MRPRNRASMSAPRRCRTAAGAFSRPSGSGRISRTRRLRIAKIHVSDQGHFGFARIDAAELGRDALGHVVPNRALGAALWSRLSRRADLDVFCPARVSAIDIREDAVELRMAPDRVLQARLVVAADGIDSAVRKAFGVGVDTRDYEQAAIITTVLPAKFHEHVAYERFTSSGPLALLPIADGRCTLVLTLSPAAAEAALGWSDQQFLTEVQARFGWRLGRLLKVGQRRAYPLSLSRAQRSSAGRCIMVGNAAQALHPVAGMGFNLGLRDVASLAELIAERRGELDTVAAAYEAWRGAGPARGDRLHRWTGARLREPLGSGAAAAQSRTPRIRSVAAGEGGVVSAFHRRCRTHTQARPRRAAPGRFVSRDFDVVVIGGGVIGATMAALLGARRLAGAGRVALITDAAGVPAAPGTPAAPTDDWDLRVFALSRASQRLLRLCGTWQRLPAARLNRL